MKFFSPIGVTFLKKDECFIRGICQIIGSALVVHFFDKGDK